jgi:hypothetical protein
MPQVWPRVRYTELVALVRPLQPGRPLRGFRSQGARAVRPLYRHGRGVRARDDLPRADAYRVPGPRAFRRRRSAPARPGRWRVAHTASAAPQTAPHRADPTEHVRASLPLQAAGGAGRRVHDHRPGGIRRRAAGASGARTPQAQATSPQTGAASDAPKQEKPQSKQAPAKKRPARKRKPARRTSKKGASKKGTTKKAGDKKPPAAQRQKKEKPKPAKKDAS